MSHKTRQDAIKLHQAGNIKEAISLYQKILEKEPGDYKALHFLGVAKGQMGDWLKGISLIEEALTLKPDYAAAHNNLGYALEQVKRHKEALEHCVKAIELDPNYADAYNNRGNSLKSLHQYEEAILCYGKAIKLKSNYAEAYNNLGTVLQGLNRHEEAIPYYEKAFTLNPNYFDALYNKAHAYLSLARFEEGWKFWEYRWKRHESEPFPVIKFPQWQGESLVGKTILIAQEQGIGDQLQMLRYISVLEKMGAKCLIQTRHSLEQLIKRNFKNSRVVISFDNLTAVDYWICMMSLPLLLKNFTEQAIPHRCPYLEADSEKTIHWKNQFDSAHKLKVGIVWKGNFKHTNDASRSVAIKELLPLFENKNIQFILLQKDITKTEQDEVKKFTNVLSIAKELENFDDTAAAVMALDLIISVDTAVAHLAGALNKRVWVLLPFCADWRWLINRRDSPWYPSAELIRQQHVGNWAEVVEEMGKALNKLAENPPELKGEKREP